MLLRLLIAATFFVPPIAQTQTPPPKKTDARKAPEKQTTTKAPEPVKDKYDPENLPPGEVACGRIGSTKAPPCQCMRHRMKIQEDAIEKCQFIEDRKERLTCLAKVPACPSVIDAEGIQYNDLGQPMAAQCKRSCRLARCECCHT